MKIIEVGRDPVLGGARVVVEAEGFHEEAGREVGVGKTLAVLQDGAVWRIERSGKALPAHDGAEVDRLLWLRRREQAGQGAATVGDLDLVLRYLHSRAEHARRKAAAFTPGQPEHEARIAVACVAEDLAKGLREGHHLLMVEPGEEGP